MVVEFVEFEESDEEFTTQSDAASDVESDFESDDEADGEGTDESDEGSDGDGDGPELQKSTADVDAGDLEPLEDNTLTDFDEAEHCVDGAEGNHGQTVSAVARNLPPFDALDYTVVDAAHSDCGKHGDQPAPDGDESDDLEKQESVEVDEPEQKGGQNRPEAPGHRSSDGADEVTETPEPGPGASSGRPDHAGNPGKGGSSDDTSSSSGAKPGKGQGQGKKGGK